MRYKEGEEPLPLAANASDDMLILTAVLGFFIGFVLVYLGRLGDQMWMRVWGVGLVLVSLMMGGVTWWLQAT